MELCDGLCPKFGLCWAVDRVQLISGGRSCAVIARGTKRGGAGTSGEGANHHRFAAESTVRRGAAVVENTREPVPAARDLRRPGGKGENVVE